MNELSSIICGIVSLRPSAILEVILYGDKMLNDKSNQPILNPFHATDLFWYPLKTSENLWFSDVFRGYQKKSVAWNGLIQL